VKRNASFTNVIEKPLPVKRLGDRLDERRVPVRFLADCGTRRLRANEEFS
jgi:hypothetical protein